MNSARDNAYCFSSPTCPVNHRTISFCEQCKVSASTYILSSVESAANLSHQDAPSCNMLTAIYLHPTILRIRVSSVFSTTTGFLVCHFLTSPNGLLAIDLLDFDLRNRLLMATGSFVILASLKLKH